MSSICRVLLIAALVSTSGLSQAQRNLPLPTVGQVFLTDRATNKPYDEAFREGLRTLGWVDGTNLSVVARYADGNDARLMPLIKELLALPVQVLMVSPAAVRAAKAATTTVPIVCPNMPDAVENGFVVSLSRPGGNLTGLTYQGAETVSKRFELTRELVPGLRRLALLFDISYQSNADAERMRHLAKSGGMTVEVFRVRKLEEIQAALVAIGRTRPQALIVHASPRLVMHRHIVMDFAIDRFPVVADEVDFAEAGALLVYAENDFEMFRRSASYIDKILKGARPGDLPIEQPERFDLIVNRKTADELRIVIPESIMLRATEIIRD